MQPLQSEVNLDALLSSLPDRQRQVLLLRYGLQRGAPLSLRQTGKRLGITGERVRLIERDAIIRLRRGGGETVQRATQPLVDAVRAAGGIARFEDVLKAVRRRGASKGRMREGEVRFLRRLDERVVRVRTRRGEVWALSDRMVGAVAGIQAVGISVLREVREGLGLESLARMVLERLPEPRPDRAFVVGAMRVCPGVVVTEGGWCFYGRPRHKLLKLVEVLREAGKPLHLHSIKERLNRRVAVPSSSHAVHEFLSRETEVFVRVAPGTFALREWARQGQRAPSEAT